MPVGYHFPLLRGQALFGRVDFKAYQNTESAIITRQICSGSIYIKKIVSIRENVTIWLIVTRQMFLF